MTQSSAIVAHRLPGQLNVKVGLVMLITAFCLGIWLDRSPALQLESSAASSPAQIVTTATPSQTPSVFTESGQIDWETIPLETTRRIAWRMCYAYLGNMGLINVAAGGIFVLMGSRIRARYLLAHLLLLGGVLHPGAWALIGITGWEYLRWIGRVGILGVVFALLVLVAQLLMGRQDAKSTVSE
jgi:hypothetical protein